MIGKPLTRIIYYREALASSSDVAPPLNTKELYEAMKLHYSNYNMLSTCLSIDNIEKLIYKHINNREVRSTIIQQLKTQLENIHNFNLNDVESYRNTLIELNELCCGFNDSYIDTYISTVGLELLGRVVGLRYLAKDNKDNIVYTFSTNVLSDIATDTGETICYAYWFYLATMYILLDLFLASNELTRDIELDIRDFQQCINFTILTGCEMFAEFNTNFEPNACIEEIASLIPKDKYKLAIKHNAKKNIVTITIKDSSILYHGFIQDGYKREHLNWHNSFSSDSKCTLRIYKNKDNRLIFNLYLSGMWNISRLFSLNCHPKKNLHLADFIERGGIFTANAISFYFRSIILNCGGNIIVSYHNIFRKFIENYQGKRNVALKTAIAILLSCCDDEEQKAFLKKHFSRNNYRQGKRVLDDLQQLNKKISSLKFSSLEYVYMYLWRFYGW